MMRRLVLPAFVVVFVGCGHSASPPKPASAAQSAITPSAAPSSGSSSAITPTIFVPPPPIAHRDFDIARVHDQVPLSIRRILSEQHMELRDVLALTAPIGDVRGRVRATNEATALANELGEIETALAATGADSERYDETVVKLRLLATRVELLHEALRGAVSSTTVLELDKAP